MAPSKASLSLREDVFYRVELIIDLLDIVGSKGVVKSRPVEPGNDP